MRLEWLAVMLALVLGAGCGHARGEATATMHISSDAFDDGGSIPQRFTCDGDDVSPPLRWSDAPSSAQAFVLIVDDPDAPRGTFVHWVLYDVPGDVRELGAGAATQGAGGGTSGKNDFRKVGWGGPCPPPGAAHRYYFKIYALEEPLGLDRGATKAEVEAAMQDKVVAQAQLMGRYARAH